MADGSGSGAGGESSTEGNDSGSGFPFEERPTLSTTLNGDGEPTDPEAAGTDPVESDWWYVVAGVVAWGAVMIAVLALSGVTEYAAAAAVPVAYLGWILLLVLPAALYIDGGRVRDAGGGWAPARTLYAVGSIGGALLPPLGVFVAGLYLYRRHRFVGVP